MDAVALRFYVHETRRHHKYHSLLFEWLLEQAKAMGVHGGSAFLAVAGFGRHGVIHEQRFFELPAALPVMVEFIVSEEEADKLVAMARDEKIHMVCTRTKTEVILIEG
jgi:PII-like signaling protein